MKTGNQPFNRIRIKITKLAAKLIATDSLQSYVAAKSRAAKQLGYPDCKDLPRNNEIEQAVIEYKTLFQAESQAIVLKKAREIALNAMQMLEKFKPRLVGPVLTGTVSASLEILIYLYCDSPEQVHFHIDKYNISCHVSNKKVKINAKEIISYPTLQFIANEILISLVIFPEAGKNLRPLDPANDRPMERANINDVKNLLINKK